MAAIPALPSAPEEKHPHASHNGNLGSCNEPQEKLDDIIQAYKSNSNKLTKEIIASPGHMSLLQGQRSMNYCRQDEKQWGLY